MVISSSSSRCPDPLVSPCCLFSSATLASLLLTVYVSLCLNNLCYFQAGVVVVHCHTVSYGRYVSSQVMSRSALKHSLTQIYIPKHGYKYTYFNCFRQLGAWRLDKKEILCNVSALFVKLAQKSHGFEEFSKLSLKLSYFLLFLEVCLFVHRKEKKKKQ